MSNETEYVAPEKIENILVRSAFIAQCFVYGDSLQNSLVAIVVPDEDYVRSWIETNVPLLSTSSIEEICKNPVLTRAVLSDIKDLSRKNQLQGFEVVRAIRLHPVPFSVDNDLMTPTFKLKRQKIRDMHEQTIKELYNDNKPISKL
jgi:long-chain acyl-CoA synthetase